MRRCPFGPGGYGSPFLFLPAPNKAYRMGTAERTASKVRACPGWLDRLSNMIKTTQNEHWALGHLYAFGWFAPGFVGRIWQIHMKYCNPHDCRGRHKRLGACSCVKCGPHIWRPAIRLAWWRYRSDTCAISVHDHFSQDWNIDIDR